MKIESTGYSAKGEPYVEVGDLVFCPIPTELKDAIDQLQKENNILKESFQDTMKEIYNIIFQQDDKKVLLQREQARRFMLIRELLNQLKS